MAATPDRPLTCRLSRRTAFHAGGAALALATGSVAVGRARAMQAGTPMPTRAADAPFPSDDQLAFNDIVAAGLGATATPGALVGVWYPGRGTWLKAAGIGEVTTALPMRLDDHVRIASNTKTFVATVLLQLVAEGALALDDVLADFITGIPNGDAITIRQVLGMTAGIYDFVNDPVISDGYTADPMLPFTPADALAIMRGSTPDFAPGERVQYSNSNYILLGMIVEDLTGQPIDAVIEERILTPLGMSETSFPASAELPLPFAHGYDEGKPGDVLRDVTFSNPGVPWASGAMISTLTDLGIWAAALADGSLLSPALQAERLQFGMVSEAPVAFGYGLGILTVNGLLGHNGGIFGSSSWVVHEPESGATIVVVTTRGGTLSGTADAIFFPLATYLFPEKFAALAAAATPTP